MQQSEFQQFITSNPAIHKTLQQSAAAIPSKSFSPITEAAMRVLFFPVVRYLLMEIGLPWLSSLKKYSEVQCRRVEEWIDEHAEFHGLDPDEVEAGSQLPAPATAQQGDQAAVTPVAP